MSDLLLILLGWVREVGFEAKCYCSYIDLDCGVELMIDGGTIIGLSPRGWDDATMWGVECHFELGDPECFEKLLVWLKERI